MSALTCEIELWSAGRTGVKGSGPLINVLSASVRERVNEASQWQFSVSADDNNIGQLAIGDEAYAYLYGQNVPGVMDYFGGEIEVIEKESRRGTPVFVVKGKGLLSKASLQRLYDVEVFEWVYIDPDRVEKHSSSTTTDWTSTVTDDDTGTRASAGLNTNEWLYIGAKKPFRRVNVTGIAAPTGTATLTAEYFHKDTQWTTVSVTDNTVSGGVTFSTDGTIEWSNGIFPNWKRTVHSELDLFWIRFATTSSLTVRPGEIDCQVHGPSTVDVDDIVTAISGFSNDASSDDTANGSIFYFDDVSGLQALRTVANTENGIFRLDDMTAKTILYLSSGNATGKPAVGPIVAQASPSTNESRPFTIASIEEIQDGSKRISAIYAFGAGNGRKNRLNMENADTSVLPAGYSLVTSGVPYVKHDSSFTTEERYASEYWPQVGDQYSPLQVGEDATVLLQLAQSELAQRIDAVKHWRMRLVNLNARPKVGDTIDIEYAGHIANSQETEVVQSDAVITEVNITLNRGVAEAHITASNVRRPPLTINDLQLQMYENQLSTMAYEQFATANNITGAAVIIDPDD